MYGNAIIASKVRTSREVTKMCFFFSAGRVVKPCLPFRRAVWSLTDSVCTAALLNPCVECFGQRTRGFITTFKQISERRYLCILRRNDHLQILTQILNRPSSVSHRFWWWVARYVTGRSSNKLVKQRFMNNCIYWRCSTQLITVLVLEDRSVSKMIIRIVTIRRSQTQTGGRKVVVMLSAFSLLSFLS